MEKKCKVEGCTNPGFKLKSGKEYFSLGYCNAHYKRFKKYGHTELLCNLPQKCKVPDCTYKLRKNQKGEYRTVKGYCEIHYRRVLRTGTTDAPPMAVKTCKVEGCESKGRERKPGVFHLTLGYCGMHYDRYRKYGDPLHVKSVQGRNRTKHKLYSTFNKMKSRCLNKTDKLFKYYGGRGIAICDRWLDLYGFENFIEDMGERPEGYSLDRIDVNGRH